MMRHIGVTFAALVAFAGCSAGGGNGNGAGPDVSGTMSPVSCVAPSQSCYCPSGAQSGTQTCDPVQGLSTCTCPITGGMTMTPPPSSEPAKVCPELSATRTCSATSFASEQVPSSILFVVDRSGSMDCNPPPIQSVESCNAAAVRAMPDQPSRWEITVKALNDAFTGLGGTSAAIGLSLFSSDGNCGVDSTPAVGLAATTDVQLSALSTALGAARPAGGTPIVGGVVVAYHQLHEVLHATGNRYVVLITDGEEGCGTKGDEADKADLEVAKNQLLNTEVEKARDANIRTFVIGAPGSEGARGFLSELAFRGGTARTPDCVHGADPATGNCHFDLSAEQNFAQVLKDTLGKISGKALGCEFQAPTGGRGLVNVQVTQGGADPKCLPQSTGVCEGGASGWQYAKDANGADDESRVLLCGAACDQATADPSTVVDVILGCGSIR